MEEELLGLDPHVRMLLQKLPAAERRSLEVWIRLVDCESEGHSSSHCHEHLKCEPPYIPVS